MSNGNKKKKKKKEFLRAFLIFFMYINAIFTIQTVVQQNSFNKIKSKKNYF